MRRINWTHIDIPPTPPPTMASRWGGAGRPLALWVVVRLEFTERREAEQPFWVLNEQPSEVRVAYVVRGEQVSELVEKLRVAGATVT